MTSATAKSLFDLKTIALCTIFSLPLLGCGGGGSDSSSSGNNTAPINTPSGTPSGATVSGGSPSSPTLIQRNQQLRIASNTFNNYFKFTGKKGEKFFINSYLDVALTDTDKQRCRERPDSFQTQIVIYDSKVETVKALTCGEKTIFTVPEDGEYVLFLNYQSREGTGYITSTTGDSAITSPTGTDGSPSNPKLTNTSGNNALSSNVFFNYYKVSANEGDRLFIQAVLNQPLSANQKQACRERTGGVDIESVFDTQIHIYDSSFNRLYSLCSESLTYTVPKTGTYIMNFSYAKQSAGYFNLTVLKP